MLTIIEGKGFTLKFDNNLTISVQFGTGNYCSEKNNPIRQHLHQSKNAEIAIWDELDKWFSFGQDSVQGYTSADELADWITATKQAKDISSIIKPTTNAK